MVLFHDNLSPNNMENLIRMSNKSKELDKAEQHILSNISKKSVSSESGRQEKNDFYAKIDEAKKKIDEAKKKIDEKKPRLKESEKYGLNLEQEYELRKHKESTAFMLHFVCFASVNVMLMVIWLITGGLQGIHPWFLYALLGWGIGITTHYFAYKSKLRKLDILYANREDYGENTPRVGSRKSNSGKAIEGDIKDVPQDLSEPYDSYVKETNAVYNSLMDQIEDSEGLDKDLLQKIKDSLNHYTERIYYLSKRGQFLEKSIEQFDADRIGRVRKSIEVFLEDDKLDPEIRKEYENAVRMLDKQSASLRKVQTAKDKTIANLSTSIITLNTLKLDFIKLQCITDESAQWAIKSLNEKAEEIDDYIEILSQSMKDIDCQTV